MSLTSRELGSKAQVGAFLETPAIASMLDQSVCIKMPGEYRT